VVQLRCTAKLLARLKATPEREPVESTTSLGDWCANLVQVGRLPLILAVSERTLLPVVLRARDLRSIVPRLARGVAEVLGAIDAATRSIGPRRASVTTIWWTDGGVTPKYRCMSASAGGRL
jgi:hypothetical protein